MRAAVMRGAAITVEDVPEPVPGAGQVLIAPHATGICGSDLHAREIMTALAASSPDAVPPIVPGHEFAGEVVAIGPGTETDLSVGDLVAVNPFTLGPDGPQTIGLSPLFGGGLAELTLADAARAVALPSGVDARLGALCEPIAVAIRAYHRGATAGPIVVVGAGPIGLGIVAVAAIAGRHPIVVVEPSATRRALASRLGADLVAEPGSPVLELLHAVGFLPSTMSPLLDRDPATATVFECVGRPDVVQALVAEAPPHSRIVLAGACVHPIQIQPLQLTTSEVTVETSFAYRQRDLRAAADHLAAHVDLFGAFVTSERPLAETAAAFDALATSPDEIKILISPA